MDSEKQTSDYASASSCEAMFPPRAFTISAGTKYRLACTWVETEYNYFSCVKAGYNANSHSTRKTNKNTLFAVPRYDARGNVLHCDDFSRVFFVEHRIVEVRSRWVQLLLVSTVHASWMMRYICASHCRI